jgi:hypothetical protein
VLLVALLVLAACNNSHANQSKKKNFVEQGEYVKFELGGEKFKVLKAYFRGGSEDRWGSPLYAKFWALLPDFETYDKSKNHYEFVEQRGWGRKVFFRLHLRKASRVSVSEIVERNSYKSGGKRFSGRLGNPDEMKYGLEEYRSTNYSFDDYLYRPKDSGKVYISCSSKIMNTPSPSCKMMWDPSESVYADATFSKAYLPQWNEILLDIQKVINGNSAQGD